MSNDHEFLKSSLDRAFDEAVEAQKRFQDVTEMATKLIQVSDEEQESHSSNDPVHSPVWYRGDGEVECKRAIASMMAEAPLSPIQGFWWGAAFKYIWRWWGKNGAQDIEKAIECMQNLRATLPD